MNRLIYKDRRLRTLFKNSDIRKTPLLYFRNNRILYAKLDHPTVQPKFLSHDLSIFFRLSKERSFHYSRARNHCIATGSTRSVYSDFKLSRMALRERLLSGKIHNVTKSSW